MRTIRGKLTLGFLLIIAVCLVPTSVATTYVLRYYQRQDALEQLSAFGQTVAGATSARVFSQLTPAEIVTQFNEQKNSNVLVVLTDARGLVQADSEGKYTGTTWPVPDARPDVRTPLLRPEFKGKLTAPDGQPFAVATYRVERRRPPGQWRRASNSGAGPEWRNEFRFRCGALGDGQQCVVDHRGTPQMDRHRGIVGLGDDRLCALALVDFSPGHPHRGCPCDGEW